jgi:hypothetical protein
MAFDLAILFYESNGDDPSIKLEPCYWNQKELMDKYHFRSELNYYEDFFLDVDLDTFKIIHNDQLKYIKSGLYSNKFWVTTARQYAEQIESIINSQRTFTKITIWIFEWESGMG